MTRKKPTAPVDLNVSLGAMPTDAAEQSTYQAARVDMPTLTMDEMKDLEAQARAEVEADLKARLKDDFLKKTKQDMKRRALFREGTNDKGELLERIQVLLPKFSDRITLDGVIYFHGCSYDFGPAQAATVKEIIGRQWGHHDEINGLDMNEYLGRRHQTAKVTNRAVNH